MIFDLQPQPKLWVPPQPAIIRAADSFAGVDRATFPFPVFCPVASSGIDPNIKMLFHFDGTNGSTTFTDSSSYGKTWTATGSPSLSTSQFKFGTASLRLGGSAYVSRSSDSDLSLTGDFIIDLQCRLDAIGGGRVIFDTGSTNGFNVVPGFDGSVSVVDSTSVSSAITASASSVSTNTWFHLMVSRVGTSVRLFINGTQAGSTWTSVSRTLSDSLLFLGANGVGGSKATGYFDEFRLVNGSGQSSNFTAPTAPY